MKKYSMIALGIVVILIGVYIFQNSDRSQKSDSEDNVVGKVQEFFSGGFSISQENSSIDISKIRQGCAGGRDCIPSIDDPQFESVQEANQWLDDSDLIFGISINGDTRAYSQNILNWHELVNDTVGDQEVLISFCPLCGTAIAFDRTVNGKPVEFGVSGKLVNSNLVMYNRSDDSLWQQQGGDQIVGDNLGHKLAKISLTTTIWGEWKQEHPDTLSLSRDTGHARNYNTYPYGDYEQSQQLLFPAEKQDDDRLHRKAVVYGIEINGSSAAYSEEFLKQVGLFADTVGNVSVTIIRSSNGDVTITNNQTGEEVVPERGFWFSWISFYPKTKLNGE